MTSETQQPTTFADLKRSLDLKSKPFPKRPYTDATSKLAQSAAAALTSSGGQVSRTQDGKCQFTCKTCNKHFMGQQSLIEHLRIHTGEQPFSCPVLGCDRKFKQRSQQFSHLRRQHWIDTNAMSRNIIKDQSKAGNGGKRLGSTTLYQHPQLQSNGTEQEQWPESEFPKIGVIPGHLDEGQRIVKVPGKLEGSKKHWHIKVIDQNNNVIRENHTQFQRRTKEEIVKNQEEQTKVETENSLSHQQNNTQSNSPNEQILQTQEDDDNDEEHQQQQLVEDQDVNEQMTQNLDQIQLKQEHTQSQIILGAEAHRKLALVETIEQKTGLDQGFDPSTGQLLSGPKNFSGQGANLTSSYMITASGKVIGARAWAQQTAGVREYKSRTIEKQPTHKMNWGRAETDISDIVLSHMIQFAML